jgi:hypothetical protein
MRFACQSCGKAYNLPEEKIAEKSNVKLKCRVCGAIVEVKRQGEIVAQLLALGKRVGRISEAPAPLTSYTPGGDTIGDGTELDDAEDAGVPVAPGLPTFNLSGSTNIASPPAPMALPRVPGRFDSPFAEPNPEPPLPAWSRPDDETAPAPPADDRGRIQPPPVMNAPPVLSPPPVPSPPPVLSPPPVVPRIPHDFTSNGVSEHTNGQSTLLRAVDPVPSVGSLTPSGVMPLTSSTDRFAAPVVPPVTEAAATDWKKIFAALLTGFLLGLVVSRLLL